MANNEFYQAVSIDFAPQGSPCEWCGKPAVQQLTAIGGKYHNEGGFFCLACGEEFTRAVSNSSHNAPLSERKQAPVAATPEKKYGSTNLPIGRIDHREPSKKQYGSDCLPIPLD
jgi:hypothetical protein